jgi:hypothetical protein
MSHHVAQLVLVQQQLETKRLDSTLPHVKRLLLQTEIALPTAYILRQELHLEVQQVLHPTSAKLLRFSGLAQLLVAPRPGIWQLAYTPRQEVHLALEHQVNPPQELEHLLFLQLAQQQAIQPLLAYILRQEQQAHLVNQASPQYDSLFPREVSLVQEMATRLFSPYIHI